VNARKRQRAADTKAAWIWTHLEGDFSGGKKCKCTHCDKLFGFSRYSAYDSFEKHLQQSHKISYESFQLDATDGGKTNDTRTFAICFKCVTGSKNMSVVPGRLDEGPSETLQFQIPIHQRCMCHCLQLVVSSLLESSEINSLVEAARADPAWRAPPPTRWWATLCSLQRVVSEWKKRAAAGAVDASAVSIGKLSQIEAIVPTSTSCE